MSKRSTPLVQDQKTAIFLGVASLTLGAYLIHDAFDNRGASRPFWLSFFPGL